MLPTRIDDVGGKRVRFWRGGEGPTIVFLHGYPDNLQMWSGVAPLLRDFDVIAFDWPGMGGSEAWAGGATPYAMADRLIALARQSLVPGAIIVGHANQDTVTSLYPQIVDIIKQRKLIPVTLDQMFGTSRAVGA